MLGGRVSRRTTCSCLSCSSAESSIVTMRSSLGMKRDRTLSIVVLPVPVPPEISTLSRRLHDPLEKLADLGRERLQGDQVFHLQRVDGKTADRKRRAVDGKRRDDGIDAGAVGKARIHHGGGLVDPAAHGRDDPVDDLAQVRIVLEAGPGQFELCRGAPRRSAGRSSPGCPRRRGPA